MECGKFTECMLDCKIADQNRASEETLIGVFSVFLEGAHGEARAAMAGGLSPFRLRL